MKRALILGCSHAAGSELNAQGGEDRHNSYPMLLAKMLGYNADNLAISGGSNDAMFRLCQQHAKHYNVVIACWTGCNRSEVWNSNTNRWQPIVPGSQSTALQEYSQQWLLHHTDETSGRLNKLKNILAMNAMCTVINVDSFWPITFDWPSWVTWPVKENFWDWANAQGHDRTACGHFGLEAHVNYAKYLYQCCGSMYNK